MTNQEEITLEFLTLTDLATLFGSFIFVIIIAYLLSHSASAFPQIMAQYVTRFKKKSTLENNAQPKQYFFNAPIIKGVKKNHGRKLPFSR